MTSLIIIKETILMIGDSLLNHKIILAHGKQNYLKMVRLKSKVKLVLVTEIPKIKISIIT
jgi:hypothetical protein